MTDLTVAATCEEAKNHPHLQRRPPHHHHHPLRSLSITGGSPLALRGHHSLQISMSFKACISRRTGYSSPPG